MLVVLLAQHVRHGLTLDSFLFAVALAVGLTPELLPMIMMVTLARGAQRLAASKVVVKRLSAIHDLGAMDVLCTDKTGTLTEAKIAHVGSFGPAGEESARTAELICLNSRFLSGGRNNLDEAVIVGAAARDAAGWTGMDTLAFDFERRRASVLVSRAGASALISKGAPEAILGVCSHMQAADGSVIVLDQVERSRLAAWADDKGRQGFRLLGVASKAMPAGCAKLSLADESQLVFFGHSAFLDPPKASATKAVAELVDAGVRVKIVSGDAACVVQHLVETLGLPTRGR